MSVQTANEAPNTLYVTMVSVCADTMVTFYATMVSAFASSSEVRKKWTGMVFWGIGNS